MTAVEAARISALFRENYRPFTDAENEAVFAQDHPDDGELAVHLQPGDISDERLEAALFASRAATERLASAVRESARTGKPVRINVQLSLSQRRDSRVQPRRSHRQSSGRTSARRTRRSGAARALSRLADEPARRAPGRDAGLGLSLAVVGGLDTLPACWPVIA